MYYIHLKVEKLLTRIANNPAIYVNRGLHVTQEEEHVNVHDTHPRG
jgi:hypothetical protein